MRHRYSSRRLLLCLVLSHALALQALLLAWSGAQAAAGGGPAGAFGIVCYGASAPESLGGTEPPAKPAGHHDCLAACLTGHAAATPPEQASLIVRPAIYARLVMLIEALRLERSETLAFLARAPPART